MCIALDLIVLDLEFGHLADGAFIQSHALGTVRMFIEAGAAER